MYRLNQKGIPHPHLAFLLKYPKYNNWIIKREIFRQLLVFLCQPQDYQWPLDRTTSLKNFQEFHIFHYIKPSKGDHFVLNHLCFVHLLNIVKKHLIFIVLNCWLFFFLQAKCQVLGRMKAFLVQPLYLLVFANLPGR